MRFRDERTPALLEQVSFHHGNAWAIVSSVVTNQGRSSLSYGNKKGTEKKGDMKSIIKAKPGRGHGFCATIADVIPIPLDADLTLAFE